MGLYEVINPSDPVTFHAPDNAIAIAVVVLLGRGSYAAEDESGNNVGGMALFLSEEKVQALLVEWLGPHESLGAWIHLHAETIIAALESCAVMPRGERQTYDLAMAAITDEDKRKAFRDAVLDKRRSSLNNICARAWEMAAALREDHVG